MKELVKEILYSDGGIRILDESPLELKAVSLHGPKRIVRIPLKLSFNLYLLAGFVIGDGHLKKEIYKYCISAEIVDLKIIRLIGNIFKNLFGIDSKVRHIIRNGKQESYYIGYQSKAMWLLFNKVFGIPAGKKSFSVKIPQIILSSNPALKRGFLTGLFLADGGFKKKGLLSFTSCSEMLSKDIQYLLKEFSLSFYSYEWTSNRSGRKVYDVIIKKRRN